MLAARLSSLDWKISKEINFLATATLICVYTKFPIRYIVTAQLNLFKNSMVRAKNQEIVLSTMHRLPAPTEPDVMANGLRLRIY